MRAPTEALIVIDVQNDFCPGGSLAVTGGDEIIPRINILMREFPVVVLTQDWHPAHHSSFASQHKGAAVYSQIEMPYGLQTLWPDHCIQGSAGAEFHPDLAVEAAHMVLRKGFRPAIDSYSAFSENDRQTSTGLGGYLREHGITSVTLVGLATDYCVAYSALDAITLGFQVSVLEGACRGIDLNGSLASARENMRKAGVVLDA